MTFDDIRVFLPKHLSAESQKLLFEDLKKFPENLDKRFYTGYLTDNHIYQGDGISKLPVVDIVDLKKKESVCMVLSNSCDISQDNERPFDSQIVYAPIVNLEGYIERLNERYDPEYIDHHLDAIRKQRVTQILYLPECNENMRESIVFLDRVYCLNSKHVSRDDLHEKRVFSLSDFGNYMFLFKLSIHFTRMQDKVERGSFTD